MTEKETGASQFPRIYLAIDNCFASKRWTEPAEWAGIIKDAGLFNVEASADNEIDPLYSTPEYLDKWLSETRRVREEEGVRVANLYSGHGTYATLGLSHTDCSVRKHILDDWLRLMVATASRVGAGLGFFCHAFAQSVLQDTSLYAEIIEDLYVRLAQIANLAYEQGVKPGLEQMYTPHQVPWTLDGAAELIKEVYSRAGAPMYITVDTGHQSGQRKFLRPSRQQLEKALKSGEKNPDLWLGSQPVRDIFRRQKDAGGVSSAALDALEREMDSFDYMFSEYEDGDTYAWLRRFGAYSPIVHLQQTDGFCSSHWPFTEEYNQKGIIQPEKVLRSLMDSYSSDPEPGMPPRCDEIYLTIEIFSGTADYPRDIIERVGLSADFWREYIPEDGVRLNRIPCIAESMSQARKVK